MTGMETRDFKVMVQHGSVVKHMTETATSLQMVKRRVSGHNPDYAEITEPDGTMWSKKLYDARWARTPSSPPPAETMEVILAQMKALRDEHARLEEKLNAFRVQCPTCQCRLLPGEQCVCCKTRDMLQTAFGIRVGDASPTEDGADEVPRETSRSNHKLN